MLHRPQKKWAQNFLRNRGAVERIAAALEPQPGEVILEIGPGDGVLTRELARYPNPILAIEVDPSLSQGLEREFGGRVAVRNADAMEVDLPAGPFRAIGNLPYNAGTPILRRTIAAPSCRRTVFMLQKEVADRTVARPGHEAYGFLALYVELFAVARILMTLEPGSFHPRPKVRSAVVVIDPRDPKTAVDRETLIALISQAFRLRRKKLVNNLQGFRGSTRTAVIGAIERAALDPAIRAEQMALADFDRLAVRLGLAGSSG
jgi:16S rRNA (adenine1518-N6/adenine1519-N6)-dimethyltransferase